MLGVHIYSFLRSIAADQRRYRLFCLACRDNALLLAGLFLFVEHGIVSFVSTLPPRLQVFYFWIEYGFVTFGTCLPPRL